MTKNFITTILFSLLLACEVVHKGDIKESDIEITIKDTTYKLYTVFDGKDYIKIMVPVNSNDDNMTYSTKIISNEESSTTIYVSK
jgi:hypothetical protein